jgi:hypothetical protein
MNTATYAQESHLRLEKGILCEEKKANKWLNNLKQKKEITRFEAIQPDTYGCCRITFYFIHKHHELQADFHVDLSSSRKDSFLSLRDATEEEFKNKILREKQFRIQSHDLESYCIDLLNELKQKQIIMNVPRIGDMVIKIQHISTASEFQDNVKKADVVFGVNVRIENEKFLSSSMMHEIGLQVKTSEMGQEKHKKLNALIPSIHMKENGELIEKVLLKTRLQTIVKKTALLRSIEFLQSVISGQTVDRKYDQFNRDLSLLAEKQAKEIHK